MSAKSWRGRTRRDLIIEVWEHLDCESVGAQELEQIQQALCQKFGKGALESPAAIARTVADEGAVLRHAEVFACDLKWRTQNLDDLNFQDALDFSSLASGFQSMIKIEEKRLEVQAGNAHGLAQLRQIVSNARKDSILRSRSRIIEPAQREELKEISQWLTIWLQAPDLFSDWLDLRRRSPEFRERFS